MSRYRGSVGDVVDHVVDIEKRVSKKERAPQLPNSTVSAGQRLAIKGELRAHGANGEVVAQFNPDATLFHTLVWYRSDGPTLDPNDPSTQFGTELMKVWVPFPEAGFGANLWIMDRFGNIVFADDVVQGNLLALPQIPWTYMKTGTFFTQDVTTTSASYASMWVLTTERSNPNVRVSVFVKCSDGSTGGGIRLVDTGIGASGVLDEQTISVGTNTYMTLNGALPIVGPRVFSRVEVEVKRTAGAGSIGTQIAYAVGTGQE